MFTNLNPATGRIPAFRNILSFRTTPRIPVIPYFTSQQWEEAAQGVKLMPLTKSEPTIPRLHYQLAPWGRGDKIVTFDDTTLNPPGNLCTPKIKVRREKNGVYQIEMGLACPAPQTRAGCEFFLRAMVTGNHTSVSPWGCLNNDCSGQCILIMEGAKTVGDLYCICSRVV